MGFIRNWMADRNNGKLEVSKLQQQTIRNHEYRSSEQQKQLEKLAYEIGVRESKQKRYEEQSKPKIDQSTKNISIDKSKKFASDNTLAVNNKTFSKPDKKSKK